MGFRFVPLGLSPGIWRVNVEWLWGAYFVYVIIFFTHFTLAVSTEKIAQQSGDIGPGGIDFFLNVYYLLGC